MKALAHLLLFVLFSVAACSDEATTTTPISPATPQPGISPERLKLIDAQLQTEVDAGVRAGFVVMIGHDGETIYSSAIGMADIEAKKPMTPETKFRIASMSKPLTTLAIMMLVERGELLLSDHVARYIPSFTNLKVATSPNADASGNIPTEALKKPMTVHSLLTHTSGLGYIFDSDTDLGRDMIENSLYTMKGDLAARINALAAWPLYAQPETERRYSYATDVAGYIVEVVSGLPLETFMEDEIFKPLGMTSTGFYLDDPDFSDLAMVYVFNENGDMVLPGRRGDNPDPNADVPEWASGGGGLVSTAGDYMRFMQMLLNEGELGGVRIVSPATVRLMLSPHVEGEKLTENFFNPGATFGLGGWVATQPGLSGRILAKGQYGWGGYYDTGFSISPEDKLAIVVMAQREPGPYAPPSRARDVVTSIAFGALER